MGCENFKKFRCENNYNKHSIKIYGNPKSELGFHKKIIIKNYLKDHRVFMTSLIAFKFWWKLTIHDKDSLVFFKIF